MMKNGIRPLILIGFMGSGKSTVGSALARRLSLPFGDTDEMLEASFGCSISEYFASEGEARFREAETELIRSLIKDPISSQGYVLSTGGGLPLRPENARTLRELGTVVYLSVEPETVITRLQGDDTRPLLRGTEKEKTARIRSLLAERDPLYTAAAHAVILTDGRSPEGICQELESLATSFATEEG